MRKESTGRVSTRTQEGSAPPSSSNRTRSGGASQCGEQLDFFLARLDRHAEISHTRVEIRAAHPIVFARSRERERARDVETRRVFTMDRVFNRPARSPKERERERPPTPPPRTIATRRDIYIRGRVSHARHAKCGPHVARCFLLESHHRSCPTRRKQETVPKSRDGARDSGSYSRSARVSLSRASLAHPDLKTEILCECDVSFSALGLRAGCGLRSTRFETRVGDAAKSLASLGESLSCLFERDGSQRYYFGERTRVA